MSSIMLYLCHPLCFSYVIHFEEKSQTFGNNLKFLNLITEIHYVSYKIIIVS